LLASPHSYNDAHGLGKCIANSTAQLWDYDDKTQHLVNRETKLCLDPMRFDRKNYPDAYGQHAWAVHMQPCGKSIHQRVEITFIDVDANSKAAENKRAQGKY
jgi:hypothetical protein